MLTENYEIRKVGPYIYVNRTVFPRITVTICFKNVISEVVEIKLIDKCTASLVVPIIEDIDQIIKDNDPSKVKKLEPTTSERLTNAIANT